MIREPDNLVLEQLRAIRADMSELKGDMRRAHVRLGGIEGHLAGRYAVEAEHNSELDRLKMRVDRIERRLE